MENKTARGYRVRLLNFDRSIGGLFDTFNAAVSAGRQAGFEFAVIDPVFGIIAGWSPISGLRMVGR